MTAAELEVVIRQVGGTKLGTARGEMQLVCLYTPRSLRLFNLQCSTYSNINGLIP